MCANHFFLGSDFHRQQGKFYQNLVSDILAFLLVVTSKGIHGYANQMKMGLLRAFRNSKSPWVLQNKCTILKYFMFTVE